MTRRLLWRLCLLCACVLVSSAAGSTGSTFTLQVLLSAGVRGRMMPVSLSQTDCAIGALGCSGGVSRRSEYIRTRKALYPNNTLTIDSGNYYFGTLFASIDAGQTVADFVTLSDYDVLGVGTVEFFGGPALYGSYLTRLGGLPVVCSNIDVSRETRIPAGSISAYSVFPINGRLVGVVGCTEATLVASSSAGSRVTVDANYTCVTYLTKAISTMNREQPGVDIIIAMAAPNYNNRAIVLDIAMQVEGIDIVVSEYPPRQDAIPMTIVTSIFGDPVAVTSIPYVSDPLLTLGASMINLIAEFDASGNLLNGANATDVQLTDSFPDDPRFVTPLNTALAAVAILGDSVVGVLYGNLTGAASGLAGNASFSCQNTGCSVGEFVTSTMLDFCEDCNIAHINAGGLRSDLTTANLVNSPNITYKNLKDILPYGNTLVYYNIIGQDLYAQILQVSINSRSTQAFQQFAGVRMLFNAQRSSILSIQIYDRASSTWQPWSATTYYKVTTIAYLYGNGDGYTIEPYAQNAFLFGPTDLNQAIASLTAYPTRTFTSEAQLDACWNTNWDFQQNGWLPPAYCTYATSLKIGNLATQCPTDESFCTPGAEAYPYKTFGTNSTSCDYCSGLGACQSGTQLCLCDGPVTEGLFAGVQMIQGLACDEVRAELEVNQGLVDFCIALGGLTCALAFLVSAFFYINRAARVVKRSSTTFLQLCCLGGAMGGVCTIFIAVPTTNTTCIAADWTGNIGFILLFGSLFIKTQRIWEIFSNTKMQKLQLTDMQMVGRLSILLLAELIMRIIETLVSPLEQTVVVYGGNSACASDRLTVYNDWSYFFQCRSDHTTTFDAIKWTSKGLLTLYGAVLAILVRDIDKNYNESKLIGAAIWNMAVFSLCCKAAIIFIDTSSPSATMALSTITINYIVISTLLGLAIPKWWHLRAKGEEDAGKRTTPASSSKPKQQQQADQTRERAFSSSTANAGSTVFQSLLTQHQQALKGMTGSERNGTVSSYIAATQHFLASLQNLSADTTNSSGAGNSSRASVLHPLPRASCSTVRQPRPMPIAVNRRASNVAPSKLPPLSLAASVGKESLPPPLSSPSLSMIELQGLSSPTSAMDLLPANSATSSFSRAGVGSPVSSPPSGPCMPPSEVSPGALVEGDESSANSPRLDSTGDYEDIEPEVYEFGSDNDE